MPKSQIFRLVDVDSIELQLSSPDTPESTVEEFYRFGTLLFSEIQQRGSEVDRKLTNMTGWSLATLGFVLLDRHRSHLGKLGTGVLATAGILSFACVLIAAFALRTRMWQAPSEKDWFRAELWGQSINDEALSRRVDAIYSSGERQARRNQIRVTGIH